MRLAEDILSAGTRERIVELCREFGVEGLGVFGSVALGEDEPGRSDVDVLVKFREDAPARGSFKHFLALRDALQDIFGRPVDLVEAKMFRNPIFAENIARSLVPLCGKPIAIEAERYPPADHGVNMEPKARKSLIDILQAGEAVLEYTQGMSWEDYRSSSIVRMATERGLEVIGEAVNRLKRDDPETVERIPEYRRIIDMRNFLIHGYDSIDNAQVWIVVEKHLSELLELVRTLLAEADD